MTPTPSIAAAHAFQGAEPAATVANTPEQWLVAAGAAVAAVVVLGLLRWLVGRRIGGYLATRSTHVAAAAGRMLQRTSWLFVIALAVWAGARFVTLPPTAAQALHVAVVIAVALQMLTWAFEAI